MAGDCRQAAADKRLQVTDTFLATSECVDHDQTGRMSECLEDLRLENHIG